MAWYEDLRPCGYFGLEAADYLRAVGWLDREHSFPTGSVDTAVLDRLREFAKDPWTPIAFSGIHGCELCRYYPEASGVSNLFIPGDGFFYVCPELICHYMNAHGYAPPAEFCNAVLACPDMRNMEYRKTILANGARQLIRAAKGE